MDAMFLFTTPKAQAPSPAPAVPQPAPAGGASGVMGALQTASETTGTSFDYLLKTARRESDLDPALKSKTSSATGLFQFLDDTWLETLKADGARYGYGDYAAAITRTPSGNLDIADPALKRQVMALREDPTANAVMAGAFTNRNAADLRALLGRQPTDGELYVAHFFGSAGARKFLDLAATQPAARADTVFPEAAAANRPIFYDKSGRARSAAEVYAVLVKQHGTETTTSPAAGNPVTAAATAPASASQGSAALGLAPEPAEPPLPFAFHGLFQTERTGPATADVRALWVPQTARAAYAAGAGKTSGDAGRPLDLGTFARASGVDTRE
ncbi:lytic transglycosylase domain-containing protein [Blastochloris sulfoviridis]|uniref:Lytic transglycosylase domain-containing protein n=2 Tax=Blastochloris sulfoviridis TaxID=50712 RepID=A0A5M6I5V5_9HYPH|nr:lytic transglycosylase domain-containing protein [Blastochloris sulfoviridis]KAA5603604.1 lytic transglycosylase domain-containing protein [Blastochloris sulfoviridis]